MNRKVSFFNVSAVLSISFLTYASNAVTPAMQSIITEFPEIPMTTILLVFTLPALFMVPATLLAGAIAGTKVTYKTLTVIGILLFVIGGTAPVFTSGNFMVILMERAIFGIGLGLIAPLANTVILGLFEEQKRASMLGISIIIANVGAIVLQLLCGFLVGIKWNYAFLTHAVGIISIILIILFFPEPPKSLKVEGDAKEKIKIPDKIWLISLLFSCVVLLVYPVLSNISIILNMKDLGGASISGVVGALFTFGGMISGTIFSTMYRWTKKYVVAIGLFIMAIGMTSIVYGGNIVVIAIGTALTGFGLSFLMACTLMIFGMIVSPIALALSMSIFISMMGIFGFGSTYWVGLLGKITGDAVLTPIFVGMIVFATAGLIFLFVNPFPKGETAKKQ